MYFEHRRSKGRVGLLVFTCVMAGPSTLAAQAAAERQTEATLVTGLVFEDRDGNGRRDLGEPGIPGVAVSDQVQVVTTDESGLFRMDARGYGLVFVSQPDGYVVSGPFWRAADGSTVEFGLRAIPRVTSFSFVHASDTHICEDNADRVRRLREIVDSLAPAFVIISGDLVLDALRVSEKQARGYYELFQQELSQFSVPVFTVPGNHDKFGIERHWSLVSSEHPLYGNQMYRHYRGPDYFSFTYGGVHFLGLDTADYDDLWWYGRVDDVQLEWMTGDVATLPPEMTLVTFSHIPFVSGLEARRGFQEGGRAPSIIELDGRTHLRHSVHNHEEVLAPIQDRLELSLQGHIHMREVLTHQTQAGEQRLITAAAVAGPPIGRGSPYGPLSGITLHRVVNGRVDDGTFLPLDPVPGGH
jgi:predicted MPP superfamily phosphohydrolase